MDFKAIYYDQRGKELGVGEVHGLTLASAKGSATRNHTGYGQCAKIVLFDDDENVVGIADIAPDTGHTFAWRRPKP